MAIAVPETNILVAVLLQSGGNSRAVLRGCLNGDYQAVLGPVLLAEYEDVLGRAELFADSALSARKRFEVFDGIKVLTPEQCLEVFPCLR